MSKWTEALIYALLLGETIMSFSAYKGLGETLKEFQVTYTEANFITEV